MSVRCEVHLNILFIYLFIYDSWLLHIVYFDHYAPQTLRQIPCVYNSITPVACIFILWFLLLYSSKISQSFSHHWPLWGRRTDSGSSSKTSHVLTSKQSDKKGFRASELGDTLVPCDFITVPPSHSHYTQSFESLLTWEILISGTW